MTIVSNKRAKPHIDHLAYSNFVQEFDIIERDPFQGRELETLTRRFIGHHLNEYELAFPEKVEVVLRHRELVKVECVLEHHELGDLQENKFKESLEDDLRVLTNVECVNEDEETPDETKRRHRTLAEVFRRASEASYLRVTYNKCRLKQEDDRREPIRWAQLAIRHQPNHFKALYWYMIAVGRYSEILNNPKDKTLAGEAFKRAISRCLKLQPNDPLSHHLLGRYYYHVGGLNWVQRTLVKSLFNFKLEGTYEDAERELLLAHSLKDDWLPAGLWMARVLLAQKRPLSEVKHWIDLALKLKVLDPTTEIEREELIQLGREHKLLD